MNAPVLRDNALDRECAVFCRYLIGQEPNEYVRRKYRTAHETEFMRSERTYPTDGFLVKVASNGPWSTKIIDAYTRVFHPFASIRKKLILLLAILESCGPTDTYLDSVDSNSAPLLFLRFVQRCLTFALIVIVGIVVIFPFELMLRVSKKYLVLWLPRHG